MLLHFKPLFPRRELLTDFRGFDVTFYGTFCEETRERFYHFEIWDSITGEPVAKGSHFESFEEVVNWILL